MRDKLGRFIKGVPQLGIPKPTAFKKGHSGYWLGKKQPKAVRRKRSLAQRGERHYNWQGGKTKEQIIIRHSLEYKFWREAVYKRDNYTCQSCGKRGNGDLNADHIKPFSRYPELRFEVSNGRTLCVGCHKKTETWGLNQYTNGRHYIMNGPKTD